ncbi:MAG: lipoyl synthase [Verrucomicrobiota bacterium]|jgi:lipoic acid synthetase|nr:lipoyl synthase [Verrucomicrobiota bacterium]MDK2962723.1 lipoyl synthase [Verrucomicrobiota bacterium]
MNDSISSEKLNPKAQRLPQWMRRPIATDRNYPDVQKLLTSLQLNTVCASAKCPNRHECWNRGTATVMILGNTCTRNCRFCSVNTGTPEPVDPDEPARVAEAAKRLNLRHVVITSVTRDDLSDGGAQAFADTIHAVKSAMPEVTVEVLTPDFVKHLDIVLDAGPEVFNHNLETVKRLQAAVRPQASYETSLAVLRKASIRGGVQVKSGLMLGLGETDEELFQCLEDLYAAGVRLLTLGQYLAPTRGHHPVERFLSPEHFDKLAMQAREIGFSGVAAGPLVRSSYRADELAGHRNKAYDGNDCTA